MKAVFLSDVHLKGQKDDHSRDLLAFLDSLCGKGITKLFIVGDFFDFWFCRKDCLFPGFRIIVERLLDLKNKGLEIVLFEGNHDFFLEDFFLQHGITVFPHEGFFNLSGKKVFIAHGDTVDVTNTPYLILRKVLRSPFFYRVQNCLHPKLLWRIAQLGSKMSKDHLARPPDKLIEIMEAFSLQKFREGFDGVLLGHCHFPVLKRYWVDGRERTFSTLGDWVHHRTYVIFEDERFSLAAYGSP